MKKYRNIVLSLVLLTVNLMLCGCMSEAAKNVDKKILELSQRKVDINTKQYIDEIHSLDSALSEKEHNSLQNYTQFESIEAEYMEIEDSLVHELEALIDALPSVSEIRLASETQILDAYEAFENAKEQVRARISNKSVLDEAMKRIEKIKEDCWIECETCHGSGIITCKKCKGKGSRLVKYTAANGKVFDVYAECYKTQQCDVCHGEGGIYDESRIQ